MNAQRSDAADGPLPLTGERTVPGLAVENYWFRRHMPTDGSVTFTDMSQSLCTVGVWGPNAEKVLAKIANRIAKRDPSHGGVFDLGQAGDPGPWLEAIAIEDVFEAAATTLKIARTVAKHGATKGSWYHTLNISDLVVGRATSVR
jgi:hypothetical protein